jgi:phospholipid/cholesterol/gamma-HCH transport system substrate-binding protein
MESDKHYFIEGLFIIVLLLGAALFAVWLTGSGHRDDVVYRIRFAESVSGMSLGDPVKYRGVDVGTVTAMMIDPADPRLVQVDVRLRKETPIKTDTRATLKLKGITGVVFIELNGGSPDTSSLLAATPPGQMPEIPAEKGNLAMLDELPKVIEKLPGVIDKFSALEDRARKVLADVGGLTTKLKENPSLLLFPPKEPSKEKEKKLSSGPRATFPGN